MTRYLGLSPGTLVILFSSVSIILGALWGRSTNYPGLWPPEYVIFVFLFMLILAIIADRIWG